MVSSLLAYEGLLALVCLERCFELALSRRNLNFALKQGAREAGSRHYPVMVTFHLFFIVAAALEAPLFRRRFPGAVGWCALAGEASAQLLRYWSIITLGTRWNTRIVVFASAEPVTAGPYRFIRHPNYLAVIIETASLPMVHGCWLTALVFSAGNSVLLFIRIRAEERALGPKYAAAFAGVARLVPYKFAGSANRGLR